MTEYLYMAQLGLIATMLGGGLVVAVTTGLRDPMIAAGHFLWLWAFGGVLLFVLQAMKHIGL